MTKVFPNSFSPAAAARAAEEAAGDVVALTVWKKSLLLNCTGFTVFDAKGDLVYRVDNYVAGNKAEIVLMDAAGKPILTIRRKRLSLGESWFVYDEEKKVDPKFSVHRHVNFRRSKTLSHVCSCRPDSPSWSPRRNVVYQIEGSYKQRSVSLYDNSRRCVAEIRRKEAAGGVTLGVDVFKLIIVRPHIETAVAMALVILLDQMFGS